MTAPWHRREAQFQTALNTTFGPAEYARGYNRGREDAWAKKSSAAGSGPGDYATGYRAGYLEVHEEREAAELAARRRGAEAGFLQDSEYVRGFNAGHDFYGKNEEEGLFVNGSQAFVRGYLDGRAAARDASIKRHGARCI